MLRFYSRLLGVLVASALLSFGCGKDNKKTTEPPPPPPPTGEAVLDFEGTDFDTWNAAGGFTFDDDDVTGGSQAITFAQDTTVAKHGTASLKISGTTQKNKYGTQDFISYAKVYLKSDKSEIDFTGKTITAYFHLATGTTADNVQVILSDSAKQACQGKYHVFAADADGWMKVTFDPNDAAQKNWGCGAPDNTFDKTKVNAIQFRLSQTNGPSTAVVWNVDDISWPSSDEPPPPPPPPPVTPDTAQLNFEETQFTTWNDAGALTYDDANTVVGLQAITFAQDTTAAKYGSASLKISGDTRKNLNGDDFISDARIYLKSDKSEVDLTGQAITVYFHLASGTTADNVQVILNDSAWQGCQGQYHAFAAGADGWMQVTFDPSVPAQINWGCGAPANSFAISKVTFLEVRLSRSSPSAAVVWNVDSISW